MTSEFWDKMFSKDSFHYGENPNAFIREASPLLTDCSAILELGCGEGRNAVYLASKGHRVTAVDYSGEGLRKGSLLANRSGVAVEWIQADILQWKPPVEYDAVVSTFLHVPPPLRETLFDVMKSSVRSGGWIVSEWFHPDQRRKGYSSGGPASVEMLIEAKELYRAFGDFKIHTCSELEYELDEGPGHKGPGAVVRFAARKP